MPTINREAAEAKAAEAARKKAEREALLAEEEKNLPSRSGPKNAKTAQKKTRGLDLSSLDEALPALNASGIDNAMDAFEALDAGAGTRILKGSGNIKAKYRAFEDRRMEELREEGYFKGGTGQDRSKAKQLIFKEWAKAPENPQNQLQVAYNATKEEIAEAKATHAAAIEARLGA